MDGLMGLKQAGDACLRYLEATSSAATDWSIIIST
jgi:hypothetical protein